MNFIPLTWLRNWNNEFVNHICDLWEQDHLVKKLGEEYFTDNNPLFIISFRDTRLNPRFEQVTDFQYQKNGEYWLVKTDRFGWEKLSHCKMQHNNKSILSK